MFTGLVADRGEVSDVGDGRLRVRSALAAELAAGDSIAVDGVCLTATGVDGEAFAADVMPETLRRTSLRRLQPGVRVNLELPLRASDRLGGHVVQGHVDGVGRIRAVRGDGAERVLRVDVPEGLLRYVAQQGSITVDGVSLTVSALGDGWFEVSLIQETLRRTTLGDVRWGRPVNLEVDVLAKYVERLMRR